MDTQTKTIVEDWGHYINVEPLNKPIKILEGQKVFFTSDTHFGHNNIMTFCKRPWKTIEEHDEALISRWNGVVGKDDLVFHLGDFAFCTNSRWKELINTLNGKIYLIYGNHDISRWPGDKTMSLFEGCAMQMMLKIEGKFVILNHYPMLTIPGVYSKGQWKNWIQLYGHVHSGPRVSGKDDSRLSMCFDTQYDVGVDNNDYRPIEWQELKKKLGIEC